MHAFSIETYAPAPDLARLIAFHQSMATDAGWREMFIPAPFCSFIFRFGDDALVAGRRGLRALPRHMIATPGCTPVAIRAEGGVDAFRVALYPHTVECILRTGASNVRDRVLDVAEFLGRDGEALIGRMTEARDTSARIGAFERWLRARVEDAATPVHEMDYAVRRLARNGDACRVHDLARELGIGTRQLERRFLRSVGLGPKLFQRVARINAVLRDARQGEPDWASLAAQFGFSDQSHLVREFVALAGETPAASLRSAGVLRAAFQAPAPRVRAALSPAASGYPKAMHPAA